MHIKQVTIKGFKSYRDQTFVEPFSPHHNVVVGRNGSGKSNFFFAIRFVLSDMFTALRANERQSLLHEGAGNAVMSAFVEIVFDNSDARIPVDHDEVVLRRSIGLKKDEYYLDNKHVNKTEVMNLLESAGFSRSNPYYIVQQGKINDLATASDVQRLQLLMEVAGTSVYDERRRESMAILESADAKRSRIEEVLADIESRLAELEGEKAELKEYQSVDEERRAVEAAIYDQELRAATLKLEEMEERRQALVAQAMDDNDATAELQAAVATLDADVDRVAQELETLQMERRELSEERTRLNEKLAALELDVEEAKMSLTDASSRRTALEKQHASARSQLDAAIAELADMEPQHTAAATRKADAAADLAAQEATRDSLLAKQGRKAQFGSKADRDAFLKEEIASMKSSLKARQAQAAQLQEEVTARQVAVSAAGEAVATLTASLESRRADVAAAKEKLVALGKDRHALQRERSETQRAIHGTQSTFSAAKEKLDELEKDLLGTSSGVIAKGLASVREIVQKHNLAGVHGPLIDLIDPDDNFRVPADVAAGNALFHVVVDTDTLASKVLSIMNREKLPGRVTFLPLNKMRPKQYNYPAADDALPLVHHVQSDAKFRSAVEHTFGRTLVCRDLATAGKYSREFELDGITMEGDKVNRRGAYSGGYVDQRKSRFGLQGRINAQRDELDRLMATRDELNKTELDVEAKINGVLSETHRAEALLKQQRASITTLTEELASAERQRDAATAQLKAKEAALSAAAAEVPQAEQRIAALEVELSGGMDSQLDEDEADQLRESTTAIAQCRTALAAAIDELTDLSEKQDALQSRVEAHLKPRLAAIDKELTGLQDGEGSFDLAQAQTALADLRAAHALCGERQDANEAAVSAASKQLADAQASREARRVELAQRNTTDQDADAALDTLLTKRAQLLSKREEYQAKMRQLGAVKTALAQKFHNTSIKTLYKKLKTCTKNLKKFSHVNKKALDQFVDFSAQRDVLVRRKETQDLGDDAILELIQVLDSKKDEAIERTFRMVAKNFKTVFEYLVPHGHGELIMKTSRPGDTDSESPASTAGAGVSDSLDTTQDTEDSSRSSRRSTRAAPKSVSQYVGVMVRVNFTGKGEDTHFLPQLSGGQKSLVALALIFAIQRCDPAPFYLFDEIDQALDPAHRTAVANMVYDSSREAQYITTTFRPELLARCDKCYGVTFKNKVSHIDVVTREQALGFIAEEAADH